MTKPTKKAVFLDRDGVINEALIREAKPYPPRCLEEFRILPGVREACDRLRKAGFLLIVATNQPDVGRGTLARERVEEIHAHLQRELPLDRIEVCYDPGGPGGSTEFRKPRPGMLLRAASDLGIDLGRSYMVGDRWRDIDCGQAAGCTTILIDYGYDEDLKSPPDYRVGSLLEAARIILDREDRDHVD